MKKYMILDSIQSISDFKRIKGRYMPQLAAEIREFLIDNVTNNGGHLASNLGVVELTLALHRHFDTPHDHIIWDVGHQSYVHKILTGRKNYFNRLRCNGGLSGFTKRSESVHDCFGAGHSSTSLSAALGFAESDVRSGRDSYTVVVLGDGAFTGGMIHEAINNCRKDLKLIIILNENEMSISRNKGGFARYMSRIRTNKRYFKVKDATADIIGKVPLIGKRTVDFLRDSKQMLKNAIYASNYFEEMGLYYMGPVDGNDYSAVSNMLEVAKDLNRSTVIHMVTKKGKGYAPAENSPRLYHMVPKGGVREMTDGFSQEMGKALVRLAMQKKDVCAITAAMPHGTGLDLFKKQYPARFYDVGIAEEHAATFAAGLAANGERPFFACYSSFLQRAYDNIIHDIALQGLPVTLCIDRTGLSEGDGATHHGIFDVAFLSSVPNLSIYTPVTYSGLFEALSDSYASCKPCAIRYPRGVQSREITEAFYSKDSKKVPYIKAAMSDDPQIIIITYGDIATEALKAKKLFSDNGISCGVLLLEKLKPYVDIIDNISGIIPSSCETVMFLEEGIRYGGASQILADLMRDNETLCDKNIIINAINDDFIAGEPYKTLRESASIDANSVFESYKSKINL